MAILPTVWLYIAVLSTRPAMMLNSSSTLHPQIHHNATESTFDQHIAFMTESITECFVNETDPTFHAYGANSSRGKMIWKVTSEEDDTFYFFYNENPRYAYSYGNMVRVELAVYNGAGPFNLHVNFTAVPVTARPQLVVTFTTAMAGYVQTPGWSDRQVYPSLMNSCVDIKAPVGHNIMISFQTPDIDKKDCMQLFKSRSCTGHSEVSSCNRTIKDYRPKLLDTDSISVYFRSDSIYAQDGFHLFFSFHNVSALPQQLPDGMWNCSVPYWADFQQHFLCTLAPECAGGEDKIICPWSDPWQSMCQLKQTPGTRCYEFFEAAPGQIRTWHESEKKCRNLGYRLPQPNSSREVEALADLLRRLRRDKRLARYFRIHVGLTTSRKTGCISL
ncbi:hypothetical protein BaRGS_00034101 [Batillaria attramentaria]|uniref:C-type lectin domain-containing protein n=1 Tax=Batillaria attramentaria TaxID=370345 RepID=A0ABD0JJN7_9CAEN